MPHPFHRSRRAAPVADSGKPRSVIPGFWSAIATRDALSLDERRRIAETQGAADIVTANGMVLSLR